MGHLEADIKTEEMKQRITDEAYDKYLDDFDIDDHNFEVCARLIDGCEESGESLRVGLIDHSDLENMLGLIISGVSFEEYCSMKSKDEIISLLEGFYAGIKTGLENYKESIKDDFLDETFERKIF